MSEKNKQIAFKQLRMKWLICLGSVIVFVFYMLLPVNRGWLQDRIFPYISSLRWQFSHTDIESRKDSRFGEPYRLSMRIQKEVVSIQKADAGNIRLLLPSAMYLKSKGYNVDLPDPVTFYYFTGLKSAKPFHEESKYTNYFLQVDSSTLGVYPFLSDEQREDSLLAFQ